MANKDLEEMTGPELLELFKKNKREIQKNSAEIEKLEEQLEKK